VLPSTALDLSGRLSFSFDLAPGSSATSTAVALRAGPSWTWCQSAFIDASGTVTLDIGALSTCDSTGLSEIHAIYLWFNAGSYILDNIRVN
jgi:hypothetical protein